MTSPLTRALGAALLLGCSLSARATPTYPAVTRDQLTLAESPPCALCHRGTPALGNATRPVAQSLLDRGALPYNEASLRTAWMELEAEEVDSDGDTVPDVEELQLGSDPNRDPAAPPEPPEPAYGYGCAAAPGLALPWAFALLWLLRRRRGVRTPH